MPRAHDARGGARPAVVRAALRTAARRTARLRVGHALRETLLAAGFSASEAAELHDQLSGMTFALVAPELAGTPNRAASSAASSSCTTGSRRGSDGASDRSRRAGDGRGASATSHTTGTV